MAQNITATIANSTGSPESIRSMRKMELVKLQGAGTAANDTSAAYLSRLQNPSIVIGGGFTVTATGNSCVFTSQIALGSAANYVWLAEAQ